MAAHPRSPFQTSSSTSSPRNTSRMTTSPPQLPLMSEVNGSRNSSFRSKTSAASGSCHSAKLHLSTRSMGSASRRSDANMALSKKAQLENDAMVYLDGPQVYTCGQCRTHLTSHDDIISKSFHGRKGRAYLFDQCVNVVLSQPEDRVLITGLHTVCDISCKRCQTLIGWTYARAYEPSQKYKEGKFIIEKINLHLEEADGYQVERPAGERGDKWRLRTSSWGSERGSGSFDEGEGRCGFLATSPGRSGGSSTYFGGTSSPTSGLLRSYSSQYHRSPKTPNRQQSSSSGLVHMSPGSPGRIIYEYREEDD